MTRNSTNNILAHLVGQRVFDRALRRRIQDGDPLQGSMQEERLVNVDVDQVGEKNAGGEAPTMVPNANPSKAAPSVSQMVEETRQQVVWLNINYQ
ncbi:unnamed protein product [Linum trigynum]|uniref:Uncharacterized protein n=1 Tax=Linum trigynum TaxID=586398 RepID=A0AAV2GSC2_9ROSI